MKLKRGMELSFNVSYKEADGTPIQPEDPSDFPAYTIYDPNGVEVASGVGKETAVGSGIWVAKWFSPDDSVLTIPSGPFYSIEWIMVTVNGRQISKDQDFEMVENEFLFDTDYLSYSYVSLPNKTNRVKLVLTDEVERVTLSIGSISSPFVEAEYPKSSDLSKKEIKQRIVDNYVVYYFDIDDNQKVNLVEGHEYLLVWEVERTILDPIDRYIQLMEIPNMLFWRLAPDIKQTADKLHKQAGLYQSLTESHILFALNEGTANINSYNPLTSWRFQDVPSYFSHFRYIASLIWLFEGQFVLTGEGNFSFGGQTVTLDYDPTSVYESAIGRYKDDLQRFEQLKKTYNYRRGLGAMAIRGPVNPISHAYLSDYIGINSFLWAVR